MTTEIINPVLDKTREQLIAEAFGHYGSKKEIQPKGVQKKAKTVTSATQSIHERLVKSIEVLVAKQSISRLRQADCRPYQIIAKKHGAIQVKLGYGKRNLTFCESLEVKPFHSIGEAVEYLQKLDKFLLNGFFEDDIEKLLNSLKEKALAARQKAKEKSQKVPDTDTTETEGEFDASYSNLKLAA
jgi:hypothetical protein